MKDNLDNFMGESFFLELKELLTDGKIGFEKENLRVINSRIAQSPHPVSLGSSLCNQYITTDFSEAQLELVTPPFQDNKKALRFLNDIHHFISWNIEDEILWPLSMPVAIRDEKEIPIAYYGQSNLAVFKQIYRNGLSHRYGRMMQAISGLHYNYSVPDSIWQSSLFENKDMDSINQRSSVYFNMLRNIYRINWLILYLFGASPIITSSFITKNSQKLKQLDKETFYLPYATSLRMSNFGYCNARRNKLKVSMNSLEEYVSDLRQATNTPFSEFSHIKTINNDSQQQISDSILQIDDEFYAVARAKSKTISNQRTTSKLKLGGVDFIELRSLDLNPFSRIGIDEETVLFLETLLIFCFIKQNKHLTYDEISNINHNDSIVAERGREPNISLLNDGQRLSLQDWGKEIIEDLFPIADVLDSENKKYTNAVEQMLKKIRNPKLTLSALLLDEITEKNQSFIDFGKAIGESNKSHYLNIKDSENHNWKLLEKEVENSHKQQVALEMDNKETFQTFVDDYMKH